MATPAITYPSADGATLEGEQQVFEWDANDTTVDGWGIRVGSTLAGTEYYTSGSKGIDFVSRMVAGLPVDGTTVYVRLNYLSSGSWTSVDTTYVAGENTQYNKTSLYYDDDCQRWYQCDRCGFLFIDSDMAYDPRDGKHVCLVGPRDYDDHERGIFETTVVISKRDPYYKEQD